MKNNKIVCPKCGYIGEPEILREGSSLVELVLWLCFFIPGLIYSIWRLNNKYDICPCCGNEEWIPADSPKGKEIADKSHTEGCKTSKVQSVHETKPTDWKKVIKIGSKIVAVIFLFIGFGLFFSYKFPYNLTHIFLIVSVVVVLIPSWVGRLLKDSYQWKFIKVNRKFSLILIGVFLFSSQLGIYSAGVGVIIGAFIHMAVQLPFVIKLGFRFKPSLSLSFPGVKQFFSLMPARLLTVGINELQNLALGFFATSLGNLSFVVIRLALRLMTIPIRLFGVPISQASLPFLSAQATKENLNRFASLVTKSLHQIA